MLCPLNKICFHVRLFVHWHHGVCPNRISVYLNLPPVRYAAGLLSVYHLQKALLTKNTQNQCWFFLFFHINQLLHGDTTYCPIIREWEQRGEPPPPRWVNFRGELIDDQLITYWSKLRSTFTYTHYQKKKVFFE